MATFTNSPEDSVILNTALNRAYRAVAISRGIPKEIVHEAPVCMDLSWYLFNLLNKAWPSVYVAGTPVSEEEIRKRIVKPIHQFVVVDGFVVDGAWKQFKDVRSIIRAEGIKNLRQPRTIITGGESILTEIKDLGIDPSHWHFWQDWKLAVPVVNPIFFDP